MGQTQYYGLAKTPNYGLDYESMIKALARVLPETYAQKQAVASRNAANLAAEDYYNAMTNISNKENELAAEQIALNEASMKAAEDAQMQQLGLGLLGTGISAYGLYKNMSLADKIANAAKGAGGEVINTEPGFLSKTWEGAKGLASDAYNKLFGPSTTETASTIALPETTSTAPGIVDMQSGWEALPNTGTSTGLQSLNLMGEAPIALESTASSTIPGAVEMGAGWEALPTLESGLALEAAEAAPNVAATVTPVLENTPYMAANAADAGMAVDAAGLATEETGSMFGSALSSIGSGISTAMPYYALAKAGGYLINSITANNPWMKDTPFGLLGETLEEPLAVEDVLAKKLHQKIGGDEEVYEYFLQTANPLEVGSWMTDTRSKIGDTLTGGLYTPLSALDKGIEKSGWEAKLAADVVTGGLYSPVKSIIKKISDWF